MKPRIGVLQINLNRCYMLPSLLLLTFTLSIVCHDAEVTASQLKLLTRYDEIHSASDSNASSGTISPEMLGSIFKMGAFELFNNTSVENTKAVHHNLAEAATTLTSAATTAVQHDISVDDGVQPPACKNGDNLLLCKDLRNYPNLTQLEAKLRRTFEIPELYFHEAEPTDVIERMDEKTLCNSNVTIMRPKAGETRDGQKVFIYNDEKEFKQSIIVEICVNENQLCDALVQAPNGYVTSCKQLYAFQRMVTITDGHEFEVKAIKIPSCCKCVIHNSAKLLTLS